MMGEGFQAEAVDDGVEALRADVAGGELGAEVAHDHAGNADVLLDDTEQGGAWTTGFVELEGWEAEAFLEDLGGIAGVATGDAAANVCVVGDSDDVTGERFTRKDWGDEEDVWKVSAAGVGVVEDVDVSGLVLIGEGG